MQMQRISYIFLLLCNYNLVRSVPLATVDDALQLQQPQPQPQPQKLDVINYDANENRIVKETTTTQHDVNNGAMASFSPPRIEYNSNNNNEWRPLGHGDPLKNDPTFDYSPPALERVRYWAASDDKHEQGDEDESPQSDHDHGAQRAADRDTEAAKQGKKINGSGGGVMKQSLSEDAASIYALQKGKGAEVPLLQPKYNSAAAARRHYAAYGATAAATAGAGQAMPAPMTHLMPPPMLKPAAAHATKMYWQQQQPQPQPQPQHHHHHQQTAAPSTAMARVSMATPHHEAPPHGHYREYYDHTPHAQRGSSAASPSAFHQSQYQHAAAHHHALAHPHHASQTEATHHYFAYTRPSGAHASYHPTAGGASTSTASSAAAASLNAIHGPQHKTTAAASRKPWLHELLQKEFVAKSTPSPTKYSSQYHHHHHQSHSHYATTTPSMYANAYHSSKKATPLPAMSGGSVYVTPTPPPVTSHAAAAAPLATTTHRPTTASTAPATTTTISTTPTTTTTATVRTTLAPPSTPSTPPPPPPPAMTTQATTTTTSSRLLIPNTSNLQHRPTVAPMVPVPMTTDALFSHYKQPEKPWHGAGGHMYLIIEGHSKVKKYGKNEIDYHQPKIVPVIPKREPVVRVARPEETTRGTPETFNVKHLHTKTSSSAAAATTTTTPMPPAAKTTTKPTRATTTTTKAPPTTAGSKTTNMTSKPTLSDESVVPPTAMSGLLSLLDNMLREDESGDGPTAVAAPAATTITKLKPVPATTAQPVKPAVALDARISSQAADIAAEEKLDRTGSSTKTPPPEFRQVFDYDQLPESRLKQQQLLSMQGIDVGGEDYAYEDEDELGEVEALAEEGPNNDSSQQLIKRIDKLVSDDEDELAADEDISLPLDDLADGEDDDEDDDNDDDEEAEAAAEAEVIEDLNIAIGRSNSNKST